MIAATHAALLEQVAAEDPAHVLLEWQGRPITVAEIAGRARAIATRLSDDGVRPGDAIALMLDNHPDHVALIFALSLAGAVWVPLNSKLKGPALRHIADVTSPVGTIADAAYESAIAEAGIGGKSWKAAELFALSGTEQGSLPGRNDIGPESTRTILFTSGTTGAPKGVIVTERMLLAAAGFAAMASGAEAGDRFHFWEPLIHVGGAQMLGLALMRRATLVMVPRFSASRFWDEVRAGRVTKAHYLGGVLDILLKQPEDPRDRDHALALAFGAGARPEVWRAFESRFGVKLVEVYGMTEASSFSTLNLGHVVGSIGKPAPGFTIRLLDTDGNDVPDGERGEIVLRTEPAELMTPGYLGNPEATAELLRGGWLHTGDIARRDADGNYVFSGRAKDMIRHKGENVSAWEVERVLNDHPSVAESAVIGVPGELGEEDILACILPAAGAAIDPAAIHAWCTDRLAAFQLPRYLRIVAGFDKTPSERIRKQTIARDVSGDIELTG